VFSLKVCSNHDGVRCEVTGAAQVSICNLLTRIRPSQTGLALAIEVIENKERGGLCSQFWYVYKHSLIQSEFTKGK
jgi:hypothetical protein